MELSRNELQDKIRGGWAGQTIGVTFGGPTEFRYNGTFIQDYVPLEWNGGMLEWWYENGPGLYDDIYMDLTFVEVIEVFLMIGGRRVFFCGPCIITARTLVVNLTRIFTQVL